MAQSYLVEMTEQWKCKACGFPENFLDACALCGATAPSNVKRGNHPPKANFTEERTNEHRAEKQSQG